MTLEFLLFLSFWSIVCLTSGHSIHGLSAEHNEGVGEPLVRSLEKRGFNLEGFINGQALPIDLSKACLNAHNLLRSRHGVADLTWDENLAKSAAKWADVVAKKGSIHHSPESMAGQFGENIAFRGLAFPGTWGPAFMVYMWYSEYWNPGYNFKDPESTANKAAGHFTQVVWKGSQKLGCAISKKAAGNGEDSYLVCQYYPGANMQGQYAANVFDLVKGASVPEKPLELAIEGCCDYSKACPAVTQFCTQHQFVREACCDACSKA